MRFPGLRLAVGTLTVIPVGPLPEIDPLIARRAMLLAPLAALPLAGAAGLAGGLASWFGLPALVVGLLMVAVLAAGTRAMHLDGLADTVDGLGSGWDRERALAVMKRGDVGPMGAIALILVLGLQAAALGDLVRGAGGALTAVLLICAARVALTVVCLRGTPAARPTGLGVVVAGTVTRRDAALSWLGMLVVLTVALGLRSAWWLGVLATLIALGLVVALVRHCVRRFGGVTGDVMGAAIEVALTVMLLVCVAR
ncbi:MAG TPA: adenosylcobinamide-GDP ribazoletransferase [Propionibacteriaceae bacterium]